MIPRGKRGPMLGIAGYKGSGKTTFAEFFTNQISADSPDAPQWLHDSFAAPIRRFAADLLDISLRDLEAIKEYPQPLLGERSLRQVMQVLGTEWMRNYCGQDVWLNALYARVKRHHESGGPVIISDVRFVNEAEFIRKHGGAVVWIERPGLTSGEHVSERGLPAHLVDYTITNDRTLEEFETRARVLAALL